MASPVQNVCLPHQVFYEIRVVHEKNALLFHVFLFQIDCKTDFTCMSTHSLKNKQAQFFPFLFIWKIYMAVHLKHLWVISNQELWT